MSSTVETAKILYIEKDASFNDIKNTIDSSNPHSITFLPENNAIYANKHRFNIEDPNNKVTELDASCTDTQYPSAKIVYDTIIENEQITAAAVNKLSINKETTANKVTSVSSSSTDTQYPSAKCVYDLFNSILSMNITSNGTTLTLQGWIDRISAVTITN